MKTDVVFAGIHTSASRDHFLLEQGLAIIILSLWNLYGNADAEAVTGPSSENTELSKASSVLSGTGYTPFACFTSC